MYALTASTKQFNLMSAYIHLLNLLILILINLTDKFLVELIIYTYNSGLIVVNYPFLPLSIISHRQGVKVTPLLEEQL